MPTKTKSPAKVRAEFVTSALAHANAAAYTPGRSSGCGRAYVSVGGDRATVNAFATACKTVGLMFLRKAYGVLGPAIYVGYDNGDGRALARAKAIAASLTASGLPAYEEAVAD